MTAILIDGSHGEGGGQILRTSIGLSVLTGKPVEIRNIRANRKPPGLRKQHLTAVLAAAEISGAELKGAAVGSSRLDFAPGTVKPGIYQFATGTAGSTTLVFQTVLPALLCADGPTQLVLQGGTHNMAAPPYDFIEKAYLPLVNRMGPCVTSSLNSHGFYPAGGGEMLVSVTPADSLSDMELMEKGGHMSASGKVLFANLPGHVAEREQSVLCNKFRNWDTPPEIHEVGSAGPGNVILASIESEYVTEVFTGFGRRGIRAEQVAKEVTDQMAEYMDADVPVGEYLADQLVLLLAIAGKGCFLTCEPSLHTKTNIEVIQQFLDVSIKAEQKNKKQFKISVES